MLGIMPRIYASDNNAGAFLESSTGARATALGNAYGAGTQDLWQAFYNPAGIYGLQNITFTSMEQSIFLDTKYQVFGMGIPLLGGYFSLQYKGLGITGIHATSIGANNRPVWNGDEFTSAKSALLLSYANALALSKTDKLIVGSTIKIIEERIWQNSGSGYGIDLGIIYDSGRNYRIGLSVLNFINPTLVWDTGAKEPFSRKMTGSLEYTSADSMLRLNGAIKQRENRPLTYHLGASYTLMGILELRGGLNNGQPSFGLGIDLGLVRLDYALAMDTQYAELDDSQMFSINIDLGDFMAYGHTPSEEKRSGKGYHKVNAKYELEIARNMNPKAKHIESMLKRIEKAHAELW